MLRLVLGPRTPPTPLCPGPPSEGNVSEAIPQEAVDIIFKSLDFSEDGSPQSNNYNSHNGTTHMRVSLHLHSTRARKTLRYACAHAGLLEPSELHYIQSLNKKCHTESPHRHRHLDRDAPAARDDNPHQHPVCLSLPPSDIPANARSGRQSDEGPNSAGRPTPGYF